MKEKTPKRHAIARAIGQPIKLWREAWLRYCETDIKKWLKDCEQDAAAKIKHAFISRLKILETTQHLFMVQQIRKFSILADISDEHIDFQHPEMLDLVANGFAILNTRGRTQSEDWRTRLVEPLALEATSEYFIRQQPETVHEELRQMLGYVKGHDGAFGKLSELYLCWVRIETAQI